MSRQQHAMPECCGGYYHNVTVTGRKRTLKTGDSNSYNYKRLLVAVALKFTVHGVQSFMKGHRKSGVISIKHSRNITNRISPL